jgi:CubicO group peptidase (beta-lactamase class C family)
LWQAFRCGYDLGINARAIDFAKIGRLFLNNGNWNGKQIISKIWVNESTRPDTITDPAQFISICSGIIARHGYESEYGLHILAFQ